MLFAQMISVIDYCYWQNGNCICVDCCLFLKIQNKRSQFSTKISRFQLCRILSLLRYWTRENYSNKAIRSEPLNLYTVLTAQTVSTIPQGVLHDKLNSMTAVCI